MALYLDQTKSTEQINLHHEIPYLRIVRIVIQRVSRASVEVEGEIIGEIDQGFMILVGISVDDQVEDADWLASKVASLRVFADAEGKMNLDIRNVNGNCLVISQFTLHAKYKKGTRPSFIRAAKPDQAIPLYEHFCTKLSEAIGKLVQRGEFGAMMNVSLVNEGPVTIVMDTHDKA